MIICESEEMYLETILRLKERNNIVRAVSIVEELGYAKSSVSRAVNLLKSRGFVIIKTNGEIHLTDIGLKKAMEVFERHNIVTAALIKMGATHAMAEDNACRIEHVITQELFLIIKDFTIKC